MKMSLKIKVKEPRRNLENTALLMSKKKKSKKKKKKLVRCMCSADSASPCKVNGRPGWSLSFEKTQSSFP